MRGKAGTHDTCWCGRDAHASGECMKHYQATRRAKAKEDQCAWTENERRVCNEKHALSVLFCHRHQRIWDAMVSLREAV